MIYLLNVHPSINVMSSLIFICDLPQYFASLVLRGGEAMFQSLRLDSVLYPSQRHALCLGLLQVVGGSSNLDRTTCSRGINDAALLCNFVGAGFDQPPCGRSSRLNE